MKKINRTLLSILSVIAISFSAQLQANQFDDKYDFIKDRIESDRLCDKCLHLTQPVVVIENNHISVSHRLHIEKDMLAKVSIPEGIMINEVLLEGQATNYVWLNTKTILVNVGKGVKDLEVIGEPYSDVYMKFEYEPSIINKTELHYSVTNDNEFSLFLDSESHESITEKSYDAYYLVNTNVMLENGRYRSVYEIQKSSIGGDTPVSINLPLLNDSERLLSVNYGGDVEKVDNNWKVTPQRGLSHIRYETIAENKELKFDLNKMENAFQSIVINSTPNYKLLENGDVVSRIIINSNQSSNNHISYDYVNIANANDVLFSSIEHQIKDTDFGYNHNISLEILNTKSQDIRIPVTGLGEVESFRIISGGTTSLIYLDNNDIVIDGNVFSNERHAVSIEFNEIKNEFLFKNPASLDIDNVAGYSLIYQKDKKDNILAWIMGDFDGKTQSSFILLILIGIVLGSVVALIIRKKDEYSLNMKILISSAPTLFALLLINDYFIILAITMAAVNLISKKVDELTIEGKSNVKEYKTLSAILLTIFFLITIPFNTSGLFNRLNMNNSLSIITSEEVKAYSLYSTPSISIIEIPFLALSIVSSLLLLIMVMNVLNKKPK